MPEIKHQNTRTLAVRDNGRSADFITPNFIYGCLGGCRNTYCYVMRYNFDHVYINDNVDQILQVIDNHATKQLWNKIPNQTDPIYYTYDIGCSTDVSLHWKHTDWVKIFGFFRTHPRAKATFATKFVNRKMLKYNPEGKVRIRFSIMPEELSTLLEPKTTSVAERIKAIPDFVAAGYEVHLNFSPIVVYEGWLNDYKILFEQVNDAVPEALRANIAAECILLTHNPWQHHRNLERGYEDAEALLWQPDMQEGKVGTYGSEGVRYKRGLKAKLVKEWQALHHKMLPWNEIRYIF